MRFLIDTNIFLEVILSQKQADISRNLLSDIQQHDFFISDYSLHSVGILLFRRNQHDAFIEFLTDMISNAGVVMISLLVEYMGDVISKRLYSCYYNPSPFLLPHGKWTYQIDQEVVWIREES